MGRAGTRALKAASSVSLVIALSKVIGFAREMILSRAFGNGIEAGAYSAAWTIMTYLIFFFSTAISAAFIPIYTKTKMQNGWERANRYANHILNLYIFVAIFLSIAAYFAAPWLAQIMYHGEDLEKGRALITELLRYMIPFLTFFAITGVLGNVCNANDRFIPEQLQGISLSICTLVACLVVPGNIQGVALASGLAGVLHLFVMMPFLRKIFKYKFQLGINNPAVHRTFIAALPSLLSLSFDEINGGVSKSMASVFAGGAAAQGRAYQLMMIVQGILVVPLTTIMYPRLSRYVAAGDKKGMVKIIKQCVEILALAILPIIAIFIVLRTEIIGILYEGNKFTFENTLQLAWPCTFYMIGVFGFGLRNFLTRVFFSMQKNRIPMIIGMVTVSLNVALTFVLSKLWGLSGITLATSIAGTVGALIMMIVLRKTLGRMGFGRVFKEVFKIIIAAGLAFGAAYAIHYFIPFVEQNFLERLIRVAACGLGAMFVYMLAIFAFRVRAARMLGDMLRSRRRRA